MLPILALYVGSVLITWSILRCVRQFRLRRLRIKESLYDIAFVAAQDVDMELLDKYVQVLKEDGYDSRKTNDFRRFYGHDKKFMAFCNMVDSIERKLG